MEVSDETVRAFIIYGYKLLAEDEMPSCGNGCTEYLQYLQKKGG